MKYLRTFFYPVTLGVVGATLLTMGFLQRWAATKQQEKQALVAQIAHSITDTQLQLSNRLASLYAQSSLAESFASQEKHALEKLIADAVSPGELDKIGVFTSNCQPFLSTSLSCIPNAPATFRWAWSEEGKATVTLQRKIQGTSNGWLVGQVELSPRWQHMQSLSDKQLQSIHAHLGIGAAREESLLSIGNGGIGLWVTPSIGDKLSRLWVTSHIDAPATGILLLLFVLLLVKMSIRFRKEQNRLRQLRGQFFQWCLHLEQNPNTPWKLPQAMRNWNLREKIQIEQSVRSIGIAMQVNHENIGKLIERCASLHKELAQTKLALEKRNIQQKLHAQHVALSHQVHACTLPIMERLASYETANQILQERMEKVLKEEAEPLVKIISFWNHSVHKYGARKFVRILDESPSETDPNRTLLESQLLLLQKSSNQVTKVILQFLLNKKKIPNFGATAQSTLAYWYSLSLSGRIPQEQEMPATHSEALSLALLLLKQHGEARSIQIVNHAKEEVIAPQIPGFVWVAALFYALEALMQLAKPGEKASVLFNKKEGEEKHHLLFSIMDYQLTTGQERQQKVEPSLKKMNALLAPFGISCHLMQTLAGMCSLSFSWPREQLSAQALFDKPTTDTPQTENFSG